jgi:hypothetical protein
MMKVVGFNSRLYIFANRIVSMFLPQRYQRSAADLMGDIGKAFFDSKRCSAGRDRAQVPG